MSTHIRQVRSNDNRKKEEKKLNSIFYILLRILCFYFHTHFPALYIYISEISLTHIKHDRTLVFSIERYIRCHAINILLKKFDLSNWKIRVHKMTLGTCTPFLFPKMKENRTFFSNVHKEIVYTEVEFVRFVHLNWIA